MPDNITMDERVMFSIPINGSSLRRVQQHAKSTGPLLIVQLHLESLETIPPPPENWTLDLHFRDTSRSDGINCSRQVPRSDPFVPLINKLASHDSRLEDAESGYTQQLVFHCDIANSSVGKMDEPDEALLQLIATHPLMNLSHSEGIELRNASVYLEYSPMGCGEPERPINATISTNGTHKEEEGGVNRVRYECQPSFKLFGPSEMQCVSNDRWSAVPHSESERGATFPRCIPQNVCPSFDQEPETRRWTDDASQQQTPHWELVQHFPARVVYGDKIDRWNGVYVVHHGTRAKMICPSDGYTLSDESARVVICDKGEWSATRPTCLKNPPGSMALSSPAVDHSRSIMITLIVLLTIVCVALGTLHVWSHRSTVGPLRGLGASRSRFERGMPLDCIIQNHANDPVDVVENDQAIRSHTLVSYARDSGHDYESITTPDHENNRRDSAESE